MEQRRNVRPRRTGRQKRNSRGNRRRLVRFLILLVLAGIGFFALRPLFQAAGERLTIEKLGSIELPDWMTSDIIEINGMARSGEKLDGIKNIVVHYVGNPGTSAKQNRDYFNNPATEVSAHFVIGLEGEIIQCLPLNEKSAASNHRNHDTISIEVCHPDKGGKFTDASYQALVRLSVWLCGKTGLSPAQIIRHYDVTGKMCPLYYAEHEKEWKRFIKEVKKKVSS